MEGMVSQTPFHSGTWEPLSKLKSGFSGTFVIFPPKFEHLLSVRNRCFVIGIRIGTGPWRIRRFCRYAKKLPCANDVGSQTVTVHAARIEANSLFPAPWFRGRPVPK